MVVIDPSSHCALSTPAVTHISSLTWICGVNLYVLWLLHFLLTVTFKILSSYLIIYQQCQQWFEVTCLLSELEPHPRPRPWSGITKEPDRVTTAVFLPTPDIHKQVSSQVLTWPQIRFTVPTTSAVICVQLSFWVLIVLWTDQLVDCADIAGHSPAAFRIWSSKYSLHCWKVTPNDMQNSRFLIEIQWILSG